MVSAYEKAVYLETVAPGLYLSDKDRQRLTAIQASQFETDEEMKIETTQMNEAQQGDTFKNLASKRKPLNRTRQVNGLGLRRKSASSA